MDLELIIQLSGLLFTIVIGYLSIKKRLPSSRSTIRADIDIFNKLSPEDPNKEIVKAHLERSIKNTYGIAQLSHSGVNFPAILWLTLTISTLAWAFYLVHDGFNAWVLIPGPFSLLSIIMLYHHLLPNNVNDKTDHSLDTATSTNTSQNKKDRIKTST